MVLLELAQVFELERVLLVAEGEGALEGSFEGSEFEGAAVVAENFGDFFGAKDAQIIHSELKRWEMPCRLGEGGTRL